MKNNIQQSLRIPRIKGISLLSRRYVITNEDKDYFRIIHQVINHYIQNNFSYLTVPKTLPELSSLTNIREETLQDQVMAIPTLYSKAFDLGDPQKALGLRQSLISDVFAWSLSDKASIQRLNTLLANSLTYLDPLTKEPRIALKHGHLFVKALETSSKMQANLLTLVDKLVPQTQLTQILEVHNHGSEKAEYLSRAEAIELMGDEAQRALTNPESLRLLAEKHGLDEAPEVRAGGAITTDGTFIKASLSSHIPDTQETILYSIEDLEDNGKDI